MPRVLTAAPSGVGSGQLGKARLAEVAAVPLHVVLADTAPCARVTHGAGHGAIRVALAGCKRARAVPAEGAGAGQGAAGFLGVSLTQTRLGVAQLLPRVAEIVGFAALAAAALGVVLAVVTHAPAGPAAGPEQLGVKVARGRVTIAVTP